MARGKSFFRKKDARRVRLGLHSTRFGDDQESGHANTAEDFTDTDGESATLGEVVNSPDDDDEISQRSNSCDFTDVGSGIGSGAESDTSQNQNQESIRDGEDGEQTEIAGDDGLPEEHASSQEGQQESVHVANGVDITDPVSRPAVPGMHVSSPDGARENDLAGNGGDVVGDPGSPVSASRRVASQNHVQNENVQSGYGVERTVTRHGIVVIPLRCISLPDNALFLPPPPRDPYRIAKAIVQTFKDKKPLVGYAMLYPCTLFMSAMELVDFLSAVLRAIGRSVNTTIKFLRPIYRMIQKVDRDVKKNGQDLEGMSLPGLPGTGNLFDEEPSTIVDISANSSSNVTTITTVSVQSKSISSHNALPRNDAPVSLPIKCAPPTPPTPIPWTRPLIPSAWKRAIENQAAIQRCMDYQARVREHRRMKPLSRKQIAQLSATLPSQPAATDEVAATTPPPAEATVQDPYALHPTTPGPEVAMRNIDEEVYQQVKSQIEAAIRAENRMINVELMEPGPIGGGIAGLRALRDKHARQVLVHLMAAKKDSMFLPDCWDARPFDMFIASVDRKGRSRGERWGAWV